MPGENIADWSKTAVSNGTADSLINWAEGQARASVNNSARGMMAAHAKNRDLQNGSYVTGGTASAQTFTSGIGYTAMPTALRVLLKIGPLLTNTGSVTLNMDGIGPFTVFNQFSQPLTPGILRENSYAEFLWQGSSWILVNVPPLAALTNIRKFIAGDTYPATSANVQVLVMCKAGGGGGGSSTTAARGGGGGEGQVSWKLTTAMALSGLAVTVGQGGAALPPNNAAGNDGGTSSIGGVVTAIGGKGGTYGVLGGQGGNGGIGGSNDYGMPGAPGHDGSDVTATLTLHARGGGQGGGQGGGAGAANSGGGGGGGNNSITSGAGASGLVVCHEFGTI